MRSRPLHCASDGSGASRRASTTAQGSMNSSHTIRTTPLILAASLALVTAVPIRAAHQPVPVDRSAPIGDPLATMARVETVVDHLATLAGRYIRLADVEVKAVLSPYAFTIGAPAAPAVAEYKLLVVLRAPAVGPLPVGSRIEVVGRPYTLAGARRLPGWPVDLIAGGVERYDGGRAVLIAELLRTIGGVELYERPAPR